MMQHAEIQKLKTDVGRHFKQPQDILNNGDLATEQKIELLKEWEIDLRQMMVASEENMPSTKSGSTADLLSKVNAALTELGSHSEVATEQKAPTKLGG